MESRGGREGLAGGNGYIVDVVVNEQLFVTDCRLKVVISGSVCTIVPLVMGELRNRGGEGKRREEKDELCIQCARLPASCSTLACVHAYRRHDG